MGTIAEKLQYLSDTKSQIGAAIEEKGVPVPSGEPFRGYADLIRDIETSGELQSGEVIPTGETFVQYPDDGYDGFSSVTVQGDPNLTPQNIAAGVTIYGKVGTLQPGATSLVPEEYQPYVEHALLLYTGEYANMAILEGHTYLSIVFLMDNFTITSFDSTTTEFKASGWLSCSLNKFTDTWTVTDWRDKPSEGQNYVKNIRYSSVYWEYNGEVIWPVGAGGGGGGVSGGFDFSSKASTDVIKATTNFIVTSTMFSASASEQ